MSNNISPKYEYCFYRENIEGTKNIRVQIGTDGIISNIADNSKLPFKTLDTCNSSNHITLLPEQKFCFNAILLPSEEKVISKYYPCFSNSTFLKSIWQPPKFS